VKEATNNDQNHVKDATGASTPLLHTPPNNFNQFVNILASKTQYLMPCLMLQLLLLSHLKQESKKV
jgi:hypothetical protein